MGNLCSADKGPERESAPRRPPTVRYGEVSVVYAKEKPQPTGVPPAPPSSSPSGGTRSGPPSPGSARPSPSRPVVTRGLRNRVKELHRAAPPADARGAAPAARERSGQSRAQRELSPEPSGATYATHMTGDTYATHITGAVPSPVTEVSAVVPSPLTDALQSTPGQTRLENVHGDPMTPDGRSPRLQCSSGPVSPKLPAADHPSQHSGRFDSGASASGSAAAGAGGRPVVSRGARVRQQREARQREREAQKQQSGEQDGSSPTCADAPTFALSHPPPVGPGVVVEILPCGPVWLRGARGEVLRIGGGEAEVLCGGDKERVRVVDCKPLWFVQRDGERPTDPPRELSDHNSSRAPSRRASPPPDALDPPADGTTPLTNTGDTGETLHTAHG